MGQRSRASSPISRRVALLLFAARLPAVLASRKGGVKSEGISLDATPGKGPRLSGGAISCGVEGEVSQAPRAYAAPSLASAGEDGNGTEVEDDRTLGIGEFASSLARAGPRRPLPKTMDVCWHWLHGSYLLTERLVEAYASCARPEFLISETRAKYQLARYKKKLLMTLGFSFDVTVARSLLWPMIGRVLQERIFQPLLAAAKKLEDQARGAALCEFVLDGHNELLGRSVTDRTRQISAYGPTPWGTATRFRAHLLGKKVSSEQVEGFLVGLAELITGTASISNTVPASVRDPHRLVKKGVQAVMLHFDARDALTWLPTRQPSKTVQEAAARAVKSIAETIQRDALAPGRTADRRSPFWVTSWFLSSGEPFGPWMVKRLSDASADLRDRAGVRDAVVGAIARTYQQIDMNFGPARHWRPRVHREYIRSLAMLLVAVEPWASKASPVTVDCILEAFQDKRFSRDLAKTVHDYYQDGAQRMCTDIRDRISQPWRTAGAHAAFPQMQ